VTDPIEGATMGLDDKFSNKAEELKGQAKESAGKLKDDPRLEGEGQADQASAGVKQKVEDLKDAIKDKLS
jgi:uncharacterized protein YjbJ (UPF0337 family)